ncbi:MAG TPA: hypothetical protein ENN69_00950, partial [Spirochaetia bacterium]|nr:hypothetical protein [Spirochaetia bacterium]
MINIHSLRFRTGFLLLLFLLLVWLINILFIQPLVFDRAVKEATDNQMLLASHSAGMIDFVFMQGKKELEAIAALMAPVNLDRALLDKSLRAADSVTQFYNYFFVLDRTGRWVSYPERPELVGEYIIPENRWVIEKPLEVNGPVFIDVVKSRVNTLVGGYITPLYGADNTPVGFLRGVLVLTEENTAAALIKHLRIGSHGYAYLVAGNGKLLAHPFLSLDYEHFDAYDYSDYPPVARLLRGESGIIEYRYENQTWIAAYHPVGATGWGVVVHQPKGDIEEAAMRTIAPSVSIPILLFIFLIVFFTIIFFQSVKPLSRLLARVRIGQPGDQPQYPKDEIGILAEEFDRLFQNLFSSREEIRKKTAHIRSIFEAARTIAFVIYDVQESGTVIQEFSPGAEKLFGYRKDETVGKPPSLIHPDT